jgi:hypothetical protein
MLELALATALTVHMGSTHLANGSGRDHTSFNPGLGIVHYDRPGRGWTLDAFRNSFGYWSAGAGRVFLWEAGPTEVSATIGWLHYRDPIAGGYQGPYVAPALSFGNRRARLRLTLLPDPNDTALAFSVEIRP